MTGIICPAIERERKSMLHSFCGYRNKRDVDDLHRLCHADLVVARQ